MLTVLSSHVIGSKSSQAKISRLTSSFLLGTIVMTVLVLSFVSYLFQRWFQSGVPVSAWVFSCGLLFGIGIAVWAFYYRHQKGTTIWLPRNVARYLSERSRSTKSSAEAFGLGLNSVIAELVFLSGAIIVSSLVMIGLSAELQVIAIIIYVVVSTSSLILVWALVGSGHSISSIQKWREQNKHFLQFAAGSGFIILAFYVYVDRVVANYNLITLGVL